MPRGGQEKAKIVERLEASRQALMDAITGLNEEGFRARAASGEPNAAEALARLLYDEADLLAIAIARHEGDAAPAASDERDQRMKEAAQRMPAPQVLHGLLAQRRETLRHLDALPPEVLARRVEDPEHGEVSVATIFDGIARREAEQAKLIRSLRVAAGRNLRDSTAL
jgi:hypothetical protein